MNLFEFFFAYIISSPFCLAAEGLLCEDKGDIVIEDTSGQSRLHSPAVLLAAQKQWGCLDTNIGVPLENVVSG